MAKMLRGQLTDEQLDKLEVRLGPVCLERVGSKQVGHLGGAAWCPCTACTACTEHQR